MDCGFCEIILKTQATITWLVRTLFCDTLRFVSPLHRFDHLGFCDKFISECLGPVDCSLARGFPDRGMRSANTGTTEEDDFSFACRFAEVVKKPPRVLTGQPFFLGHLLPSETRALSA